MMKQRIHAFFAFLFSVFLFASTALGASTKSGGEMRGAVNINTATSEELQRLPGIGPKKAEDIIAYRQKRPFTRISQLAKIKGIGPKTLENLKPYIILEGETDLRWVPLDNQGTTTSCKK